MKTREQLEAENEQLKGELTRLRDILAHFSPAIVTVAMRPPTWDGQRKQVTQ